MIDALLIAMVECAYRQFMESERKMPLRATVLDIEYKKLWKSGVTLGLLNQVKGRSGMWKLQCNMGEDVARDDCKEDVRAFLVKVADAYDFAFFRQSKAPDSEFWVSFHSELL